jgi:hypothetical protein
VAAGLAVVGTAQAAAICDEAGAQAEAAFQIPTGLLRAIGRVESGRRDPATGAFAPWPFTINANGQGRFFDDAASATAAVRSLQAAGTSSIDVGCFQVNLMHHPLAFVRLEDGFDPATNAAYAAGRPGSSAVITTYAASAYASNKSSSSAACASSTAASGCPSPSAASYCYKRITCKLRC